MENLTPLVSTGTAGTIIGVLVLLYRTFNHKRCRSRCCNKSLDMSIDIENTTPPNNDKDKFENNNPIHIAVSKE